MFNSSESFDCSKAFVGIDVRYCSFLRILFSFQRAFPRGRFYSRELFFSRKIFFFFTSSFSSFVSRRPDEMVYTDSISDRQPNFCAFSIFLSNSSSLISHAYFVLRKGRMRDEQVNCESNKLIRIYLKFPDRYADLINSG